MQPPALFLAERYRDYQVRDAARHQRCSVNEIQVEDDDESAVSGSNSSLANGRSWLPLAPPLVAIAVWSVTGRDGGRSGRGRSSETTAGSRVGDARSCVSRGRVPAGVDSSRSESGNRVSRAARRDSRQSDAQRG